MILASKGKLSVAQTITAADEISENVIQMIAADYAGLTDLWWVVDTNVIATGDGADTFKFALVISTSDALTTNQEVCSVNITGYADLRLATAGRHIAALNVGKMLKEIMETSGDTYYFVGMENTLSDGSTISIDASLSPTEPQTLHHKMVTVSNVALPLAASDDAGEVV